MPAETCIDSLRASTGTERLTRSNSGGSIRTQTYSATTGRPGAGYVLTTVENSQRSQAYEGPYGFLRDFRYGTLME